MYTPALEWGRIEVSEALSRDEEARRRFVRGNGRSRLSWNLDLEVLEADARPLACVELVTKGEFGRGEGRWSMGGSGRGFEVVGFIFLPFPRWESRCALFGLLCAFFGRRGGWGFRKGYGRRGLLVAVSAGTHVLCVFNFFHTVRLLKEFIWSENSNI